jgi:hypothetical protein
MRCSRARADMLTLQCGNEFYATMGKSLQALARRLPYIHGTPLLDVVILDDRRKSKFQ